MAVGVPRHRLDAKGILVRSECLQVLPAGCVEQYLKLQHCIDDAEDLQGGGRTRRVSSRWPRAAASACRRWRTSPFGAHLRSSRSIELTRNVRIGCQPSGAKRPTESLPSVRSASAIIEPSLVKSRPLPTWQGSNGFARIK